MGNYYLHGKLILNSGLLSTWEIIIYMGNYYLHGKLLFAQEPSRFTGFKKKKEHKVEEHETAILF